MPTPNNQQSQPQQPPTSKPNKPEKRLVTRASHVFMEQTSPKNPFGPNYQMLSYETKVAYKYNSLMPFVQLTKEDAEHKLNQQLKYTGIIAGSMLGGAILGVLLRRVVFKPFPRLYELATDYRPVFYGFFIAGCTTEGYFLANEGYQKNVCEYLLGKYLNDGVKNGFQDYQISGLRSYKVGSQEGSQI